ncbi:MAG: aromatic amino acid ammonia-lyase [Bacteroidetes bacterium]|nr:aromatic amino acid ammonia-lyase [Bacteroidota bacterium]
MVLPDEALAKLEASYLFLEQFIENKVIYGVNTGFGPMVRYRIPAPELKALQYNLIRSHATGVGALVEPQCVKSALICRLLNMVQGCSGIHPEAALLIAQFINRDIIPVLYEHGSVGASGDLVQLAHIALCLIGEGEVHYKGEIRNTSEVLATEGLSPISVHIREGLSLINGTSVMTGIGMVNLIRAYRLFDWAIAASCMINEMADSYDDSFSVALNKTKLHLGQQEVALAMCAFLQGSQMIRKRYDTLYKADTGEEVFKERVQEYYSLRCVPQILGPVLDTIKGAEAVLLNEANSVNDNPVVDMEAGTVLHGGNFHGDYVSLEMDKLKIAITRLTMLMERQLNFLVNPRLNEKFPPFVNLGVLGLNLGMQGAQFTATSTTAESQTLCFPNYIHSIPNNNDNQDIVSMGTNSAQLCKKVIENGYEVMSVYMICLAQAVETLSNQADMSHRGKQIYDQIRALVPAFAADLPKYREIALVKDYLMHHDLPSV